MSDSFLFSFAGNSYGMENGLRCRGEDLRDISLGQVGRSFDAGDSGLVGNALCQRVGVVAKTVAQGPGHAFFAFAEQAGAQMNGFCSLGLEQFGLGHDIVSGTVAGHDPGEGSCIVAGESLFSILQTGETTGERAFVEVLVTADESDFGHGYTPWIVRGLGGRWLRWTPPATE